MICQTLAVGLRLSPSVVARLRASAWPTRRTIEQDRTVEQDGWISISSGQGWLINLIVLWGDPGGTAGREAVPPDGITP
jgi:hypothetical protein